MQRSLTKGPITSSILLFALPLMLGNLLQQMYNIADTWVVGRFLGADALAAVVLPEKEALKKQIAQKQKPGTFLSRLARNRFRVPTFARC